MQERLRLLTIAAYIRGGIIAAFSCFFLIYVLMFAIMGAMPESAWANNNAAADRSSENSSHVASPSSTPQVVNQPPPKFLFGIMAAFFGVFVLLGGRLVA